MPNCSTINQNLVSDPCCFQGNDKMGKNGAITLFTRSQRVTFKKDAHLSQDKDMITDKEILH